MDSGIQSSTLRSYISAIKSTLELDDYHWNSELVLLGTLTKACKNLNDRITPHLPIHKGLLQLLLFQLETIFSNQPYLECMFKAFFLLSYYGLFRPGELAAGPHTVKAKDVCVATNKDKMFFILYSSKTHGLESRPQKVKISGITKVSSLQHNARTGKADFCLFRISHEYLAIRGNYTNLQDPFFILSDNTLLSLHLARRTLHRTLSNINLDPHLYNLHSFRIGRSRDLLKLGYRVEQVKSAGRWKSNVVYKYLRTFD